MQKTLSFLRAAMHQGCENAGSGLKSISTPKLAVNNQAINNSPTKSLRSEINKKPMISESKENQNVQVTQTVSNGSKKIRKTKNKPKNKSQHFEVDGDFSCPHCFRTFTKAQALGGHVSKKHPNKSDSYNLKIQKRRERSDERALLNLAKRKFFEFYPNLEINSHRWKVTHLKTQIKCLRAENPDASDD